MNAIYQQANSLDTTEYKKASKTINYCALGPPHPAKLRVTAINANAVSLEWTTQHYARPEFITGYRLVVNGELSTLFDKSISEFAFADMQPGKRYDIEIVTLTNAIIGQSNPSNMISVMCPHVPNSPLITQLPTIRPNSVVIGWKPSEPRSNHKWDDILFYK